MEPPHARSGRRFVFTAVSFLLPVRLPLPPRFVALTTSPSPPARTRCTSVIQSRLHSCYSSSSSVDKNSLQSHSPSDNSITAAAAVLLLIAAPSTRSRCCGGGNVHPL
ncbi:unnamed protein product, partial [Laminaria digitata]